jgi:chromosome partitioning protein
MLSKKMQPRKPITGTRVTLVNNDKGGDCKTTTATFLASCLKHLGYNPLLLDYEGSGHATYAYGLKWQEYRTMYHVFKGEAAVEEIVESTEFGDIIPGNDSMDLVDSYFKKISFADAAFKLKEQIEKLKALKKWSHIIIDTQPLIRTLLPVQSVLSADDLVLPMQAVPFSVQSMGKTWKAISQAQADNPQLRVAGILICRYANTIEERGHRATIENWAKVKGLKVFERPIRASISVSSAQGRQRPLFEFSLLGNSTTDYMDFVKEYLSQEGK